MAIARATVRKDIPFTILASLLLLVVVMDSWHSTSLFGNTIGRLDGVVLLAGFAAFMYYTFSVARKGSADEDGQEHKPQKVWVSLLFVVLGLLLLVLGSNLFVDSASAVASALGVSEGVIGLTIVAGGTSLPELATSVVAARKGQSAIAIGNVIGSNVFNILLILGLTATVCPMQITGITLVDLGVMLVSVVLLWGFCFTKYKVERWEGAVLTAGYLVYLVWLLHNI
jgi:cation:H+ antiporter